jgi:hypothetical protein
MISKYQVINPSIVNWKVNLIKSSISGKDKIKNYNEFVLTYPYIFYRAGCRPFTAGLEYALDYIKVRITKSFKFNFQI